MAPITITITADEDALRSVASGKAERYSHHADIVRDPIALALPMPRVMVKPGMVLQRKSDNARAFTYADAKGNWLWLDRGGYLPVANIDPDEWTVVLDAEDTP